MRLREWHKNVLLASASCLVFLAIGELATRLFWQPGGQTSVIRADPLYGWALRPRSEQHSVHTDRGLDYHIGVNSLGLRDRERPRARHPGVQRVLFLGDSIVFGAGVESAQRCSDVLETLLGPG